MSDIGENSQTMPVINKRPRLSILQQNEGSGDDTDDVSSTVSTLQDDTQSDSSNLPGSKQTGKNKKGKQKLKFKCSNWLKEDHKKPIFGVLFNTFHGEKDPLLFITVGHNRVTLYESKPEGHIKLLQAYADPSQDENYYCGAWTYDDETQQPLICVAGLRGIVRVISPIAQQCIKHFIGHGAAVNELKVHPNDHNMLLSVSRDNTMRLWNVKMSTCVIIFGGVDGHRDEVLSADFNIHGTKLISCGMDHSLKMWKTDTEVILDAMKASYTYNAKQMNVPFPTHNQNFPDFSTRDIHRNYVDCVRWLGNFVLSKSCENCIILWKAGTLEDKEWKVKEGKVSVLHRFDYKECDIWYMRFSLDAQQKTMALGNQVGRIFVWDIDVEDPVLAKCSVLTHPKCYSAVRQTCFSPNGDTLLAVCDDGSIWCWDKVK
ncbi:polycomb protein EED-like [Ruditapes philippinarum]|uniref:polycomb protein EED-like n=1 Tax=Ruditapes philippinarum TaxID=129788 RepID=UPI00295B1209|nr:polycomb protein EED-like [Ruditapes philippinarum]